jgi:hypothetical protein
VCSVGLEHAWPLENSGKWIRVKLKILILCSGCVDLKILLTVDSCEIKTKIGETEALVSFLAVIVICYVYLKE